jgi:hypothetical protein
VALRVGTIQKAFQTVESKHGPGRIFGRFAGSEITEPRASAAFLHLTLEQGSTDFGPFFGHPVGGSQGYDATRYFPDQRLTTVLSELAQGWKEAVTLSASDPTGALRNFVAGNWHNDPSFPSHFGAAVGKLQSAPALRGYTMRYLQHSSAPPGERPRVGGPRAMKLFRGLLSNASKLKQENGFSSYLRALTREYFQKKGLDPAMADKGFPKYSSFEKTKFAPEEYARFLEARLAQTFAEVTPNTASYALRDLAKHGGGQLLAGSEHAFLADRDTTGFLIRSGLQGDVAPKANLLVMDEKPLREVHQKAFDLLQTEFIMTNAELSERMALAARERLV